MSLKRRPARQQPVQNRSQPVDVRGGGSAQAESFPQWGAGARGRCCLFRRHVAGRSQRITGQRQPRVQLHALGQAEIRHVGPAVRIEQDVRRLQIAVQNAPLVRIMHRPRHGRQQPPGRPEVRRKARPVGGQAAVFEQLHAEVELTLVFADFVDRHDVRVVQVGDHFGLIAKALDLGRLGPATGPDHLQSDPPMEAALPRLVNHAHAALPDFFQVFIVAKGPRRRHTLDGLDQRPQRCRQPADIVVLGKKLLQLAGEVGILGQKRLPIRHLSIVDRFETGDEDLAPLLIALGRIGRPGGHRSPQIVLAKEFA